MVCLLWTLLITLANPSKRAIHGECIERIQRVGRDVLVSCTRNALAAVSKIPKFTGLCEYMDEPAFETVEFGTYFFLEIRTRIIRGVIRTPPFSQQRILDKLVGFNLIREEMVCQLGRYSVGSRFLYRGSDHLRLSRKILHGLSGVPLAQCDLPRNS